LPEQSGDPGRGQAGGDSSGRIEIDARQLSELFAVPEWLRGVGQTSWLLVGFAVFLVGAVWLLALTQVIVLPVLAAGIVAAVASPLVARLQRHGIPRGFGTALLLVAIVGIGIGVALVIVGGIVGQFSNIDLRLAEAKGTIAGGLEDLGVNPGKATDATQHVSSTSTDSVSALLHGIVGGLSALSSIAFFLAMTALSLFFLLKDGPSIRAWTERHLGVPAPRPRSE
jgi:predicted PurR-regulated permease PerM